MKAENDQDVTLLTLTTHYYSYSLLLLACIYSIGATVIILKVKWKLCIEKGRNNDR